MQMFIRIVRHSERRNEHYSQGKQRKEIETCFKADMVLDVDAVYGASLKTIKAQAPLAEARLHSTYTNLVLGVKHNNKFRMFLKNNGLSCHLL